MNFCRFHQASNVPECNLDWVVSFKLCCCCGSGEVRVDELFKPSCPGGSWWVRGGSGRVTGDDFSGEDLWKRFSGGGIAVGGSQGGAVFVSVGTVVVVDW